MQVTRFHSPSETVLSGPANAPSATSSRPSASKRADGAGEAQRTDEWIGQLQNLPEIRDEVVANAGARYLRGEFNSREAITQTAASILNRH